MAPADAIMICKKPRRSWWCWRLYADRDKPDDGGDKIDILMVGVKDNAIGKIIAITAANRQGGEVTVIPGNDNR